jgi:hypothetical protein
MKISSNGTGNVRDVSKHSCANTASNLANAFEIDRSRIR